MTADRVHLPNRLGYAAVIQRHLVHPTKLGKVTVPGHAADEIPRGTLNSIRQQAGWKE